MTNRHAWTRGTEAPNTIGPTIQNSTSGNSVGRSFPKGTIDDGTYMLGHSPAEIRRLINQAAILRPITERLLRSAGITRGMRVLDLGCGAGDVSMLGGEFVGASGMVVGIDRNAQVLAVAKERAQAEGFPHVTFTEASLDTFADPVPFDFVIARYVLLYQVDPVAFLKRAALFARPGGILALHELIIDRPLHSLPHVALWQQTSDSVLATFRARAPSWDAAGRLIELFSGAGLPDPMMFCETPVGGGADAPHYAWLAGVVWTLLPSFESCNRDHMSISSATSASVLIDWQRNGGAEEVVRIVMPLGSDESFSVATITFCGALWISCAKEVGVSAR
jgi:SAM-dependent methyltransferase